MSITGANTGRTLLVEEVSSDPQGVSARPDLVRLRLVCPDHLVGLGSVGRRPCRVVCREWEETPREKDDGRVEHSVVQ